MTTQPNPTAATPPVAERFAVVEAAMKKHQFRPDALIEVLHAAQNLLGHLAPELLSFVARRLKLPPSRVHGVATFYHFFTLTPKGAHTCAVCTGTACYVKGAERLLAAAEDRAGIHAGETTADGRLTLATTRCVGTCGLAPLVVLDGEILGHATPDDLAARVKGWLNRGAD
jgi:bidirectional [NiFe] hydrogenase diaphorase subunit